MESARQERVDAIRSVVLDRHAAHARLGLPRVDVVLDALDRLEKLFDEHRGKPVREFEWCPRCREDSPCAEVLAGEELLGVIETTETKGLEKGAEH